MASNDSPLNQMGAQSVLSMYTEILTYLRNLSEPLKPLHKASEQMSSRFWGTIDHFYSTSTELEAEWLDKQTLRNSPDGALARKARWNVRSLVVHLANEAIIALEKWCEANGEDEKVEACSNRFYSLIMEWGGLSAWDT